jgi:ketosteroid isomerase-like protein
MAEKSHDGDVQAIRALIARWAEAVRREDLNAIRADHDPDILMFDVPRHSCRGAWMPTWRPGGFSFQVLRSRCLSALKILRSRPGRTLPLQPQKENVSTFDRAGRREPLEFRLTMGLRKIDGKWRIMHEHHSLPALD